jgi:Zn finger protein HypA/HybF involved in hydrogenase expression
MPPTVINCKKCQRVFQRLVSDYCPDCMKQEDEQQTKIYRALQKSALQGGIEISNLSEQLGIAAEDIEKLYFEGRLATGGTFLKIPCQSCRRITQESERKGRFCLHCSEKASQQAGVSIRPLHTLRSEEDERKKNELRTTLNSSPITKKATPTDITSTVIPILAVTQSAIKIDNKAASLRQYGFSHVKDTQSS